MAVCGVLATGAAARDLPRGETAHVFNGCEAFGPDFHKVEGTETCVRLSGSVRVEATMSTGGSSFWPNAPRH